ncbi:unnamed protein product [Mytilus edulis]|uniref:Uncharacterized protein n=1 Tax=Mytilus edulis TaxID=6550 RepID=A0A8S3TAM2_MYTED|nr:unnamed protein product [Mytilus edulis]
MFKLRFIYRIFNRDDIYNTGTKMQVDNLFQNTDEVHEVSSYKLKGKEGRLPYQSDTEEVIQIVDIIEPEVRIENKHEPSDDEDDDTAERLQTVLQQKLDENKHVPSDNEEEDTADRLQRVLQLKLDENKKEAELLRMQTFEKNKKKRERLEKQLLSKIERNRMDAEKELRFCRHKQEQEEMLRESSGEMDEILSGRGGPLKKTSYGLLGNPQVQTLSFFKDPCIYNKIVKLSPYETTKKLSSAILYKHGYNWFFSFEQGKQGSDRNNTSDVR